MDQEIPDLTASEIAQVITEDQKVVICALSSDWKEKGYNIVHADILAAVGGSRLRPGLPDIVECEYYKPEGQFGRYRHRLTPVGLELQAILTTDKI